MTSRERGVVGGLIAAATAAEKRSFSHALETGSTLVEATEELRSLIQSRTGANKLTVTRRQK